MRQTRHGVCPGRAAPALVLGLGAFWLLGGSAPARARTTTIQDHRGLLRSLLSPHRAGTRYRFSKRVKARGELDAEWMVLRNRPLLRSLTWLRTAALHRARVASFSFLSRWKGIERLDLSKTRLQSLRPLRGLKRLVELDVSETAVRNVAPLTGCPALSRLDVAETRVTDLTPLKGRRLDRLVLGRPGMTRLPRVEGLGRIGVLKVRRAAAGLDLGRLQKVQVEQLVLDRTPIRTLKGLSGHPTLSRLSLRGTRVPRAAIRAFLTMNRSVTVVTPAGKLVGRIVVWVKVAPNPLDYPCLTGIGECAEERFGPSLRPRYHWVDP